MLRERRSRLPRHAPGQPIGGQYWSRPGVYPGMGDAAALALMNTVADQRIAEAVAAHTARLRAFVRRQVADAADVEEIVQEVFSELTRALRLMQPVEHLAAWLTRIARNRIIDRFRARSRAPAFAGDDGAEAAGLAPGRGDGPEAEYRRDRFIDDFEAALAELPAAQREVFIAHELEGLSFKELAAATGLGVNTLLGRKHAAVRHLRQRLRPHYEDFEL